MAIYTLENATMIIMARVVIMESAEGKQKIVIGREELENAISEEFKRFRKRVLYVLKKAQASNHRIGVVIQTSNPVRSAIQIADLLIKAVKKSTRKENKILFVIHDEFVDEVFRSRIASRLIKKHTEKSFVEIARYEKSERFLGTTFQYLVMDLSDSLKPNDIGRLIGIIEGGGLVILVTPPFDKWPESRNLFRESLAVPQFPKPRAIFVRWFIENILASDAFGVYDSDEDKVVKFPKYRESITVRQEIKIPEDIRYPKELYGLALTMDQVRVIKAIEELIKKPKKRTSIVITANRGRGKSSAVGIAIVGLIRELQRIKNKVRVGVTARSIDNVESLMMLARKALDRLGVKHRVIEKRGRVIEIKGDRFSIEYWEPTVIPRLDLDVVIVDEAAGLPVNMLWSIWRSCNRSIFSTTIHGYEGAGRGFSVRFLKKLKQDPDTELHIVEMEEPIRYGVNDPVEKWQFRVLLLDAEPDSVDDEDLKLISEKKFIYRRFSPEELFTFDNEKVLRSLFGIYVQAHYRNEPDDLGMIADAPHHRIRALQLPNGKIVAAAQLAEEGPIPDDLVDIVLSGGKMPGNIIPDRLIKHYRVREIAKLVGWRIVRIAVHPDLQGKGVGSAFLNYIVEEATEKNLNWVGSGFGASEELLRYWIRNSFIPLHISPDRNPVSGEYTTIVIRAIDEETRKLVSELRKRFIVKIIESMHDTYRDMEPPIARLLLKPYNCEELDFEVEPLYFNNYDLDRLKLYIKGPMTYESCNDLIAKAVKWYIKNPCPRERLKKIDELMIIAKTLQGRSWDDIYKIFNIPRGKAVELYREIIYRIMRISELSEYFSDLDDRFK